MQGQPRDAWGRLPGRSQGREGERLPPPGLTPAPAPRYNEALLEEGRMMHRAAALPRGQAAGRHHGGGQLLAGDGVHGAGRLMRVLKAQVSPPARRPPVPQTPVRMAGGLDFQA